jgi:hypothetical protein
MTVREYTDPAFGNMSNSESPAVETIHNSARLQSRFSVNLVGVQFCDLLEVEIVGSFDSNSPEVPAYLLSSRRQSCPTTKITVTISVQDPADPAKQATGGIRSCKSFRQQ